MDNIGILITSLDDRGAYFLKDRKLSNEVITD